MPTQIANPEMNQVKLGLVQMAMVGDRDKNLRKALRMVRTASKNGAQVVCLPELFDSLYFPQEEESKVKPRRIPNETTEALAAVAESEKVVLVGGSLYESHGGKAYNTSVVFNTDGRMIGSYRKVHIPQDPGFYEQDYFDAGTEYQVFATEFGKIGVLICFDQWYPEPARINKLMGADIVFYPTAIGTMKGVEQAEGDWQSAWEAVQRGHAIANSAVVAAVNRVGLEGEMKFWGGSFVYDQFGKILARADTRERVLVVPCDLDLAADIEKGWGFLRNRKPGTYGRIAR
jgi:predicted amidohydrolase